MVVVAQLVRVSVCGSEGRGFEPHHPPKSSDENLGFFCVGKPKINKAARKSGGLDFITLHQQTKFLSQYKNF